jgi:hypothetical protein
MRISFARQQRPPATPPTASGWLTAAYGQPADALVDALPALMEAAAAEALSPRTRPSNEVLAPVATARGGLAETLLELRSLLLTADVTGDDVNRDLRLRAALAQAIGAARGLALASSSQPTRGDLAQTQTGVNAVLVAAGRRGLASGDASHR